MMLLAPLTGSTVLEPKDAGDDVGEVGMLCDLAVHRAEDLDRTAAMHPPLRCGSDCEVALCLRHGSSAP